MGQPKTKSSGFRDKFSKWMKPKDNARVPAVSPVATEDIPQRPFNGSATASEVVDANDLQNNHHATHNTDLADHVQSSEPTETTPQEDADPDIELSADSGTDVWSAAYREAVSQLGADDRKKLLVKGKDVSQLLTNLETKNEELAGDSIFRRGLRKMKGPLESFKMALSLVAPLTSLDPQVSSAFGIIQMVTAIAIGAAGAEESLIGNIQAMLQHVSYIDECDVLNEHGSPHKGIHKALVIVYKDLAKFYIATSKILNSRILVIRAASQQLNNTLPTAIDSLIKHCVLLRSEIQAATLALSQSIHDMLVEDQIRKLLGVDRDSLRSDYHCKMRDLRADKACDWFTASSTFANWVATSSASSSPPFLSLYGDMGSGKTVTASHVIDELIIRTRTELPAPCLAYHYCRDEQDSGSIVSIYATLLLQLLNQRDTLKLEFKEWYDKSRKESHIDPVRSASELSIFFARSIKSLDRPVYVVLDGMDECEDESREQLIEHLRQLCQDSPKMRVMFSSRNQENIRCRLADSQEVVLEKSVERDQVIIRHKLKSSLSNLSDDAHNMLVDELSAKSSGSAIWITLVIESIKRRRTTALGPLKRILTEFPAHDELFKLYSKLFTQMVKGDEDSSECLSLALDILSTVRRPITLAELTYAIATEACPEDVKSLADIEDFVDQERIRSLIEPFVTTTKNQESGKERVQPVHQSLKELTSQRAPKDWVGDESSEPKKQKKLDERNRRDQVEGQLLRICVRYLLLEEFKSLTLLTEDHHATAHLIEFESFGGLYCDDDSDDEGPDDDGKSGRESKFENYLFDPASRNFGHFFTYAACFWLSHLKPAAKEYLPTIDQIIELCRYSQRRINWSEQYCRPDCTVDQKFEAPKFDPLFTLACHGPVELLQELLDTHDIPYLDDNLVFMWNSMMITEEALIEKGDMARCKTLFRSASGRNIDFFYAAMRGWTNAGSGGQIQKKEDWDTLFDLVYEVTDIMVAEKWGNELLCVAASKGCIPILERLFTAAKTDHALKDEILKDAIRTDRRHQSVGEAVWNNQVESLRYLVQQDGIGAHLRHRDSEGSTVFHKAARYCFSPELVTTLLEHYAEGVNVHDDCGTSPLAHFVADQYLGTSTAGTRVLLTVGKADVTGGADTPSRLPLRTATRLCNNDTVRLLIDDGGADPRSVLRFDESGTVVGFIDYLEPVPGDKEENDLRIQSLLDMVCELAGLESGNIKTGQMTG